MRFESYASMRPQRNAGENAEDALRGHVLMERFNEAPAKCRGKHRRTI